MIPVSAPDFRRSHGAPAARGAIGGRSAIAAILPSADAPASTQRDRGAVAAVRRGDARTRRDGGGAGQPMAKSRDNGGIRGKGTARPRATPRTATRERIAEFAWGGEHERAVELATVALEAGGEGGAEGLGMRGKGKGPWAGHGDNQ